MTSLVTPEQIVELVHNAGHHYVVASIANCEEDPSAVVRWITGKATPSPAQAKGLLFTYKWIEKVPDRLLISSWLVTNVKLANWVTPVSVAKAIGLGDTEKAGAAIRNVYVRY